MFHFNEGEDIKNTMLTKFLHIVEKYLPTIDDYNNGEIQVKNNDKIEINEIGIKNDNLLKFFLVSTANILLLYNHVLFLIKRSKSFKKNQRFNVSGMLRDFDFQFPKNELMFRK